MFRRIIKPRAPAGNSLKPRSITLSSSGLSLHPNAFGSTPARGVRAGSPRNSPQGSACRTLSPRTATLATCAPRISFGDTRSVLAPAPALSGVAPRLHPSWHALCGASQSPSVLEGSRFAMKQKSRVPKPRKPTLAHMVSDLVRLLKAMEDLERLREKVRLAENIQRPH
jgi:hypothetical protein